MEESILVEVSARHIHLSQKDLEALFGPGYQLRQLKKLSQADDFAAEEKLDLKAGQGEIKGLRIIGPVRRQTQIEISRSDAIALKINPPLRISGDLKDSAGATLQGPHGSLTLEEGLIVAKRHFHCSSEEAERLALSDNQEVSFRIVGERALTFKAVIVRVSPDYQPALHLDTDEGNAAGITKTGKGYIVKNN